MFKAIKQHLNGVCAFESDISILSENMGVLYRVMEKEDKKFYSLCFFNNQTEHKEQTPVSISKDELSAVQNLVELE